MSVIIGRALPDIRDGLKPVHRRILYAMQELGLQSNKKYTKSAKVVGHVMDKYHPHGDSAIYDALVRIAQDSASAPHGRRAGQFRLRRRRPARRHRYTEARLTRIAGEMLADIDYDTVDSHQLRRVLARAHRPALPNPQSARQRQSGIAVGMATNIPPHNLTEVVDA